MQCRYWSIIWFPIVPNSLRRVRCIPELRLKRGFWKPLSWLSSIKSPLTCSLFFLRLVNLFDSISYPKIEVGFANHDQN